MATAALKKPAAKPAAPTKAATKAAPAKSHDDKEQAVARANGDLTIAAKLSDHDQVVSVNYNFGKDLDEMTELFTPEVVYNKAMDSMVIDAQAKLRRHLRAALVGDKDGKKTPMPKDTQELFADWKPSAGRTERKSAAEKVQTLVGKVSAEERADLIKRLREAA